MSDEKKLGPGPNPEFDGDLPRCSGGDCPQFDSPACDGEHKNVCEKVVRYALPGGFESALVVTFAGPGSAEFTMKPVGIVSGGQLASLGQSLISRADFLTKMAMNDKWEKQRSQISVPGFGTDGMMEELMRRGGGPS